MNMNRMIQMFVMRFAMRFLNRGINAGLNKMAPGPEKTNAKDMSPEDRAIAKAAREQQRRTKQAMRLNRRF